MGCAQSLPSKSDAPEEVNSKGANEVVRALTKRVDETTAAIQANVSCFSRVQRMVVTTSSLIPSLRIPSSVPRGCSSES